MTNPNAPDSGNPFYTTGSGIYGDPNSVSGNPTDYQSWSWKQIEAAIIGSSAVPPGASGAPTTNQAVADPQSLFNAATAFNNTQSALAMIAKSISDQATALAGPNGAWKGASADQFYALMSNLSNDVAAKANQINGGSADVNPVPQQLWVNGEYLQWAQQTIRAIDTWYGTQAAQAGH